jgi:hypothetical protein
MEQVGDEGDDDIEATFHPKTNKIPKRYQQSVGNRTIADLYPGNTPKQKAQQIMTPENSDSSIVSPATGIGLDSYNQSIFQSTLRPENPHLDVNLTRKKKTRPANGHVADSSSVVVGSSVRGRLVPWWFNRKAFEVSDCEKADDDDVAGRRRKIKAAAARRGRSQLPPCPCDTSLLPCCCDKHECPHESGVCPFCHQNENLDDGQFGFHCMGCNNAPDGTGHSLYTRFFAGALDGCDKYNDVGAPDRALFELKIPNNDLRRPAAANYSSSAHVSLGASYARATTVAVDAVRWKATGPKDAWRGNLRKADAVRSLNH